MLSRVADRIYWMSRYLERAENTARLISVYSQLLLDLPAETRLDWSVPLQILGLAEAFDATGQDRDELEFLLADGSNEASLMASLRQARENARTTRDVMPLEAWNAINALQISVRRQLPNDALRPSGRLPAEIIRRCHEITGIIEGGMSHGSTYQFVRLGRSLERADMTSRIIDVAAASMMTDREDLEHHASTIWRNVLRALSAYQMYRQFVRRRIIGEDVLRFLLFDRDFPRSVNHSIAVLRAAACVLPRSESVVEQVDEVRTRLAGFDLEGSEHLQIHCFIDELQLDFAALHTAIYETWLNPARVS